MEVSGASGVEWLRKSPEIWLCWAPQFQPPIGETWFDPCIFSGILLPHFMEPKSVKWNNDLFLFDNLKFIAIFAICFHHAYFAEPLKFIGDAVAAFAVPVFAFTSGFGGKNLKDTNFFKKTISLYLVGNVLYIPYYFLGSVRQYHDSPSIFFLILGPTVILLWYILALLIWRTITPFVMQLRYPLIFATIGSALLYWGAESLMSDQENYGRHVLHTLIRFGVRAYPFYLLGVIASRDKIISLRRSNLKYLLILPSLLALYLCGTQVILNSPKSSSALQYAAYMIAATTCVLALVAFVPGRSLYYITGAGQRTLGIYILHALILRGILGMRKLPLIASLVGSSGMSMQIAGSIVLLCFAFYISSLPIFVTALTAATAKVESFLFVKTTT